MSDNKAPDFEPPTSVINRIIKNALPDNIQLTKEARAAFVRAVGIFIFYITHASNEFSRENKRQTIYPNDVIAALKELGFEDFERPLEDFLEAYRRENKNKSQSKKTKENDENGEENVEEDMDNAMGDFDAIEEADMMEEEK